MKDSVLPFPLNDKIIKNCIEEVSKSVRDLLADDLCSAYLYGSCARGDYREDSDIDIAVMTHCDRMAVKQYSDGLAEIATELAMKYYAIVNFVCIPYGEFLENKSWYPFFANIEKDGVRFV